MTNEQTAKYLKDNINAHRGLFGWPTDACGYDQHIKFIQHRNENWHGEPEDWKQFVLDYADSLVE